jgi:hypothetical protein
VGVPRLWNPAHNLANQFDGLAIRINTQVHFDNIREPPELIQRRSSISSSPVEPYQSTLHGFIEGFGYDRALRIVNREVQSTATLKTFGNVLQKVQVPFSQCRPFSRTPVNIPVFQQVALVESDRLDCVREGLHGALLKSNGGSVSRKLFNITLDAAAVERRIIADGLNDLSVQAAVGHRAPQSPNHIAEIRAGPIIGELRPQEPGDTKSTHGPAKS